MTIASAQNSVTALGNGTTSVFSFPFVGDSASAISVTYTDALGATTKLLPSQYALALNAPLPGQLWGVGGTVTYPLSGSPIASGTSLTISRILPLQQLISISDQGDFSPQVIEEMGDTLEMQIQQVSGRTGQIRGIWQTATLYNYGDIVEDGIHGNDTSNLYMCAVANTSTTWAADLANGDWSLALNVQAIVNTLPTTPNNTIFGNISGITATPTGITLSAYIDSAISNVQGSVLYRSGAGWIALPPGTAGQFLATGGASANPAWVNATGIGTITGVNAGAGLSGGGTTGAVTVSLASIADGTLLANTTGASGPAGATTLSALIDETITNTQGAILYRNNLNWTALSPAAAAGYVLQSGGGSANPSWFATLKSLTSNGYLYLPGGLILQWAYGSSTGGIAPGSNASVTIGFPINFPNAVIGVHAVNASGSPNLLGGPTIMAQNTTAVTVNFGNAAGGPGPSYAATPFIIALGI